jgi:hypothetical protein
LAQTNRGGISGTIKDTTGAAVPGATVTVTAIGTNRAVQLVSSGAGAYSAPSLEPTEYRVTVEMPGFTKAVVDHVKVDAGTPTVVNVTISTGGVQTELTVTADAPPLYAPADQPSRGRHPMERTLDPARLGDHLDRLYRAAWALCGSREDAEDLVQDTYTRVLARPRLLRHEDEAEDRDAGLPVIRIRSS